MAKAGTRTRWLALLLLAAACSGSNAVGKGSTKLPPGADAQAAYEQALLGFRRGDCLSAEPQFREIRKEFPYSRFAALSELRVADCLFKDEKYPESIQMYRQFVRARPSHPEIPYARFRIAEAYFEQVPSGWFMTPPSYQRDLTAARDSLVQLRRFIVDFPDDDRVPEAQQLIEECMELLAQHELWVAEFYLKRDAYQGVIARLKGMLASYPGTSSEPKALLLLGETYLKADDPESAQETFLELVQRHPESPQAAKAQSKLSKLPKG